MEKSDVCRSCVDCGSLNCSFMNKKYPEFCLTENIEGQVFDGAMSLYREAENKKLAVAAAEVEAENYCRMTRIEEIMEFAKKIGADKLGIATCVGLIKEARTAAKIFRNHGFEVYGVCCKVGAVAKHNVGIPEKCEEVGVNMCNPILQAKLLNEKKTGLNIVIGLCVGHDCLFNKYSEAPVTTLVTKDRVLGHNPAAALYQAEAYYSKLLEPQV